MDKCSSDDRTGKDLGKKRGTKAPWMPFYGDDFFTSPTVRFMPRESRMIYLELLWLAWNAGGIPADDEARACCVDMSLEQFAPHWSRMAKAWQPHGKILGLLVNYRQEEERLTRTRRSEQRREAGLKGSSARWGPKNGEV